MAHSPLLPISWFARHNKPNSYKEGDTQMWNRWIVWFIIFSWYGTGIVHSQNTDPALTPIQGDPTLPNVLLIGDSISIGYTLPVRELLSSVANVHRIPENGGPTSHGLKKIDQWLGDTQWDVIHFNWGLHDLKIMEDGKHQVPLEDYIQNLTQLVARLKQTNAKLIWASTTPVPDGDVRPKRIPADVIRYNDAARSIMIGQEVTIDDLYAFAVPFIHKIQRPVNVHFTEKGSAQLAEQVTKAIQGQLDRLQR